MCLLFKSLQILLILGVIQIKSQSIIYTNKTSEYTFKDDLKYKKAILDVVTKSKLVDDVICQKDSPPITHWMYNVKDSRPGIKVSICDMPTDETIKTTSDFIPKDKRLVACIPALFETNNYKIMSPTWNWIEKFLNYYSYLGVDHFLLYTTGPKTVFQNDKLSYTWMDISWSLQVKKKKSMWYYGQYWSMNDCLYRNKQAGTQWALFQDYDELYSSLKFPSLLNLIDSYSDYESLFLGNYIGKTKICDESAREENWKICEKYSRSDLPECRSKSRKQDSNLCPSWKGRRKHLDKVSSVYLTKVHKVLNCKASPCNYIDIDTKISWLDHFNGQPFNNTYDMCICK